VSQRFARVTPAPLLLAMLGALAAAATLSACSGGKPAQSAGHGDSAAAPDATAWHDPSPHTVRFVSVPGVTVPGPVRIEVLDWGGTGQPLVFVPGLEDTGHIFDDFAPQFTDHFHVLAVSRRGWGASDHPDSGYTIPALASDVHAVLDSLHLSHVDLVGHSIAGQELTWVAATYPGQVDRLVYLDAGFDYHAHPVPRPYPEPPAMTAADSASPAAGLAYARRLSDAPIPEATYRATEKLSPSGRDLGPASPPAFTEAVVRSAEALAPPFGKVHVPVLAIYDWPISAAEFLPWIAATDTSAPHWLAVAQKWHAAQRDEFKAKVPRARIIELRGATHYIFLVRPDTVAHAMRAFLAPPSATAGR